MTPVLQSLIAGHWLGQEPAQLLRSAVNGHPVAHTHAEAPDFGQALDHARRVGLPTLLQLGFQERAAILKALARYLGEHKETLYALSAHTGATRNDGWIDIEGGSGTLAAYAAFGGAELPGGNLVHEGPVLPLSKKGGFAGTHVLVPRGGVAVHINAFNFPVWGLLEKFAPSFLAGMPCIAKPATATSYLTEACVRLMMQSGLLPAGALQLVIGSTGDLLGRLQESDAVTFTVEPLWPIRSQPANRTGCWAVPEWNGNATALAAIPLPSQRNASNRSGSGPASAAAERCSPC